MGSKSEILFHEILNVQKIPVGWIKFFFLALKFGRNNKKNNPVYDEWIDILSAEKVVQHAF